VLTSSLQRHAAWTRFNSQRLLDDCSSPILMVVCVAAGLSLGPEHAPVRAEGSVDGAEAGWAVALLDGFVALSGVPEGRGGEVPEGAHGVAVHGGAVGLGAVLDHRHAVRGRGPSGRA
jgi:hypothetical protein